MSTAPVVVVPHVSWLKKAGQVIAKVLHLIASSGQPIEQFVKPVAEALLPQFLPEIELADKLFSNIVKEAIAAEAVAAAAGSVSSGPAKLTAVLANIGPALDVWVAANFPGSKAVSDVSKAGLVNAVVAIINEIHGGSPITS